MGKGDRKTKKGKIHIGTFGRSRPRKSRKNAAGASGEKSTAKSTKK